MRPKQPAPSCIYREADDVEAVAVRPLAALPVVRAEAPAPGTRGKLASGEKQAPFEVPQPLRGTKGPVEIRLYDLLGGEDCGHLVHQLGEPSRPAPWQLEEHHSCHGGAVSRPGARSGQAVVVIVVASAAAVHRVQLQGIRVAAEYGSAKEVAVNH